MTTTVGVSLKMYFGHSDALEWFRRVAALDTHGVELFVIPSFLAIPAALEVFAGTGVTVGAQDLFWEDAGAFTGEVSGAELAELGVGVVEVGHAERRRLFGETEEVVALKTAAALRNGITPVLCIGEPERSPDAAAHCIAQLEAALAGAPAGRVIVAYEPVWAIGAAEPAPAEYIRAVTSELKKTGRTVIYGGSAGPGLLTALGGDVDGVFLGRFAHDVAALAAVLDEAAAR
ncbi:MAG: triosephosphate isomerase [Rhodoglobus sp.]|nr:triosephosphate isomerase [Rhodoglobus sp.]